jgi:hypothetical protein
MFKKVVHMKNIKIIALVLLGFVYSCSKERIEEKQLNEYNPPYDYLNSKQEPEQEYVIDTNGTCPLVGLEGTELCVAKTCLSLPNGNPVYFPYTIKLMEQYTPKSMIYAQMPTVAGGSILETAGQVKVTAFKNGTALQLNSGCAYSLKMPSSWMRNYLRVYAGVDAGTYIDWTDVNIPFAITSGGHSANVSYFGWVNSAKDRGSATSSKLTFTSKTDKLENLGIFIYIPDTKTVMQVYNLVSGDIPNESKVKIIAIGIKANGDIFKFYKEMTVNKSEDITVKMQASSDPDITSILDNL